MTKPAPPPTPLPSANSEGYGFLQLNFEGIPHPGVDYNINHGRVDDDLGKPVKTVWDAVVIAVLPVRYSWGTIAVLRSTLPTTITSAGQTIPKGTIIYPRYAHLHSTTVNPGQLLKAGATIGTCGGSNGKMPGTYRKNDPADPNGQWNPHLHYDIRNGGPTGLQDWDAGNPTALQDWPSVKGYGYPAPGHPTMLRTVALRYIDPNAAIPHARQANAYRTPAILAPRR